MKRESFKSNLGFLLVSAGCAIGIGNVWKFPFVTGINGGGIFVVFYLLFLVIMGIPILTMELAVGRAGRGSALKAFKALEPAGSSWHVHGILCIIGNYLLMMYYTTVAGWMVAYLVRFMAGTFSAPGVDISLAESEFASLLAKPSEMIFWMAIVVVAGFGVCSFGLKAGIEKVTKVMMAGLIVLILGLAIYSFTLDGAGEGIRFYLIPDVSKVRERGLFNVITAAMNQAFFTLSLGIASMEIFGSYMSKDNTLGKEAIRICVLDTFVAILSGLIIFPACFSYNVEPGAGPSLIFIALPKVFMSMKGGRIFGTFFFLFMTFAAFSTVIAVFENIMAATMENLNMDRKKASLINTVLLFILSIPCVLGFNKWMMSIHLPGGNVGQILDAEDFVVSNLLLPIGSLIFLLFCVSKWGWGYDKYIEEANTGAGVKLSPKLKPYFKYILPILILIILIKGLI